MKKTLLTYLVILLFLAVVVTIVLNFNKKMDIPSWDKVSVSIKKDTLTPMDVTLIVKNSNRIKYDCYFFDKFYIDKKDGNTWYELPVSSSYVDLLVYHSFIEEDAPYIYEQTINWSAKYGSLQQGETYRIRFEPPYYNKDFEISGQLIVEFSI